jgi:hypothetical protein
MFLIKCLYLWQKFKYMYANHRKKYSGNATIFCFLKSITCRETLKFSLVGLFAIG